MPHDGNDDDNGKNLKIVKITPMKKIKPKDKTLTSENCSWPFLYLFRGNFQNTQAKL